MAAYRIVIADDEPDLLKLWVATFRLKGFEVLEAGDGEQALHLIQTQNPDAALLDFMMPKMTGIEVCEQARQSHPALFIAIVSGVDSDKLKELSEKARANRYVEKPVRPTQLIEIVQQGVAQSGAATGS